MLSLTLAVGGTLLITFAVLSYIGLRQLERGVDTTFTPCGLSSPDGSLTCTDFIEHFGWCSNGEFEWSDDVWNIGWFDDTAYNVGHTPPPSNTATQELTQVQAVKEKPAWRRVSWKVWVAVFLTGTAIGGWFDEHESPAARPTSSVNVSTP